MRVLVIEDFAPIRTSVAKGLREAGFAVDEAFDGDTGLWQAQSKEHDVIILDLMLPGRDGLSVLGAIRAAGAKARVLILTARDQLADKVRGLEEGADDYLVKPFQFAELLARVRALVRRKYESPAPVVKVGDMTVDLSGRVARRGDQVLDLSPREFAALEFLALNAERTVSRSEVFHHMYDSAANLESNVIDVLVARLRAKLEEGGRSRLIYTRRGFGYVLSDRAKGDQ